MEFSFGGFSEPLFSAVQQLVDLPDELERQLNPPTRAYVRDRRAMANTPMDVKELPSGALVLAVDMPGVTPADVRVQVEEGNVLTISGERRRTSDDAGAGDGAKYLRMERRMGKFMRRFPLPESADLDSVRAEYRDGVLTVTVDKLPPPEPKKPRVVEIKVGGGGEHGSAGAAATKGSAGAGEQQAK